MKFGRIVTIAALIAHITNICTLNCEQEKNLFNTLQISMQIPGTWISDWNTWTRDLNTLGALTHERNYIRTMQYTDRALFNAFPGLHAIDHISLCALPTQIEKLEALSTHYNQQIYIKRDDMTGGIDAKGNPKYGGNKRRKLEFLAGQALAHGATDWITYGCAGSNHALCTSFIAQELGCKAHCMLAPQPNSSVVQQNLLLHLIAGSDLNYYYARSFRCAKTILMWTDLYHTTGKFPYIIPIGGSNEVGALGFVNAAFELKQQIDQGILPKPARIYVACGSCATSVGLALGCTLAGLDSTIVAVSVQPEDELDMYKKNMRVLTDKIIQHMQSYDASVPAITFDDLSLELCTNFCGPDYGVFTPEGRNAMEIMKEMERCNLEGTYTAKACAALLDDLQNNKIKDNEPVLFWNTYYGIMNQDQLRTVSYKQLPEQFHTYFEKSIQ